MKGSGALVASVIAASTVAFSSPGDHDVAVYPSCSTTEGSFSNNNRGTNSRKSSDKEKFAPRFDGLRFIETLVTAHR
ncbi:uncharacterized protein LOC122061629 [Macadamia integrifolia]|uniref:uncharacterized protein LOC122061629 n=1 Tax=Macadamia integrifolia TaxID=60698 RepID=UPI001C5281B1|nr:uncharacterized protein LOC122061629 [Macadamia integrifolia]